jgi:hypothetical protein
MTIPERLSSLERRILTLPLADCVEANVLSVQVVTLLNIVRDLAIELQEERDAKAPEVFDT